MTTAVPPTWTQQSKLDDLQEAVTVRADGLPRLDHAGAAVWRNILGGNRGYAELPLGSAP